MCPTMEDGEDARECLLLFNIHVRVSVCKNLMGFTIARKEVDLELELELATMCDPYLMMDLALEDLDDIPATQEPAWKLASPSKHVIEDLSTSEGGDSPDKMPACTSTPVKPSTPSPTSSPSETKPGSPDSKMSLSAPPTPIEQKPASEKKDLSDAIPALADQITRANARKRLNRFFKPRCDGTLLAPQNVVDAWNSKDEAQKESMIDQFLACGLDKAWPDNRHPHLYRC